MKHVFFEPWIGKDYNTGGIFSKKILVLGESHYCGSESCNQCGLKYGETCEDLNPTVVIETYLSGHKAEWTRTITKFERSLVNKETNLNDSKDIWNSVAFFNFLQVAMKEPRQKGTAEDYEEGRIAFLEVVENLQPDLIIVWGSTRLYDNLPETGWLSGDNLEFDGKRIRNGYYQLMNGCKSRLIAVNHPSTGYSPQWWYKVISSQM